VTPLRTKIWLAVLLEHYGQAMTDMEALADLLSREVKSGGAAQHQLAVARTMGLLFGYLAGPVGDNVSATSRAEREQRVQERLTPELKEAFRNGQRDALAAFQELQREYEQKEVEARQESERRRVAEMERITAERKRMAEQHEQLKADISRARDELQSDLDALAAAESPLLQQQASGEQRRLRAVSELADLLDELDFLADRLARERDPVIRARLRRELRRLELIADDVQLEVLDAERQIAVAQNEIAGLRRQRAQLQAAMNARIERAERDFRNLEQREKRLTAEERDLQKPILDSRPLLPLERKMESLATYAPFPLEEEKSRLLNSL
jgi:chromosome segregation ATPase